MTVHATLSEHGNSRSRISIYDWMVVIIVLAALALGWLLEAKIAERSVEAQTGDLVLAYPASWQPLPTDDPATLLKVRGSIGKAAFQPTLTVEREQLSPEAVQLGLTSILAQRTISGARELPAYRNLGSDQSAPGSNTPVTNNYAYVYDPSTNALAGLAVPEIVRAQELLILKGQQLYVVTFAAAAADWEQLQPTWDRIRASVRG